MAETLNSLVKIETDYAHSLAGLKSKMEKVIEKSSYIIH